MPNKNVTISIPEPLWEKARMFADRHSKSLSALIREQLENLLRERDELQRAHEAIAQIALENKGDIDSWTREDLYEI